MVQQCFSEEEVNFGVAGQMVNWMASATQLFQRVPSGRTLSVNTATVSYFPTGTGTVGRVDICGRDTADTAVWRLQCVYVAPNQTVHLPFPKGMLLEQGGHVELSFTADGPGTIFVSLNATLE